MIHHPNVLVAINLEEVSTLGINDEPSGPELVVVLEVEDFDGVSKVLDELLLCSVKRKLVKRRLLILSQRIIHVKSDCFDPIHLEFTVAEDVVGTDDAAPGEVLDRLELCRIKTNIIQQGIESIFPGALPKVIQ